MLRVMCGVRLGDRKRVEDFMPMLDLNEAVDQSVGDSRQCVLVW